MLSPPPTLAVCGEGRECPQSEREILVSSSASNGGEAGLLPPTANSGSASTPFASRPLRYKRRDLAPALDASLPVLGLRFWCAA